MLRGGQWASGILEGGGGERMAVAMMGGGGGGGCIKVVAVCGGRRGVGGVQKGNL